MSPTISPRQPVHPHARGERDWLLIVTTAAAGSSPRPWGTPVIAPGVRLQRRFIPTPVGNASRSRRSARTAPVHPHARGERAPHTLTVGQVGGSSPRPWGTRGGRHRQRVPDRFIPTPVGNAGRVGLSGPACPVHPHARGERERVQMQKRRNDGSSPRPWGTQQWHDRHQHQRTVHPHARGERRLSCLQVGNHLRFIPTPVGNARPGYLLPPCHTVHPHARGERCTGRSSPVLHGGSSPRPWGTPHRHRGAVDSDRFIPTPVGNAERGGRPMDV